MPSAAFTALQKRLAVAIAESIKNDAANPQEVTAAFLATAAEGALLQKIAREDFIDLAGHFYDTVSLALATPR